MNNNNQIVNNIPNTTDEPVITNSEAPNRKFFIQTLETHLAPDEVKKILADLDKNKGWNEDRTEKILTKEDEKKLKDYKKLEVQDLPNDWKIKLERLKDLEKRQVNFNEIKKELSNWTDAFGEKKSLQVQEEINDLTTNLTKVEEELKTWKDTFNHQTSGEVNQKLVELENKNQLTEQEIKEIGAKLQEWTQAFGQPELVRVKEEWEDLKKRPDIHISEKDWWDDYARRQPLAKTQEKEQELVKLQEELAQKEAENKQFYLNIKNFFKAWRTLRYVLIDVFPTNTKEAREKIAELLKETEEGWTYYLDSNNITDKNSPLLLNSQKPDKKERIRQVLEWIKEARTTSEYEKLFERWNNGSEYNEEYDYDAGSLYLLSQFLEVKDSEPSLITN